MSDLRDILDTATLNATIGYNGKVGLLLSGGMDSLSVLLACLDIGIKPTCYTFHLKGVISEDLQSCRKICNIFDVQLVEIPISFTSESMYKLSKEIIYDNIESVYFKNHIKTCVQCQVLMSFVPQYVKEDVILSGLNADDLCFNTRLYGKMSANKTPSGIRKLNETRYIDTHNEYRGSYKFFVNMFAKYRIKFIDIYRDDQVREYFYGLSYKQCTSPKPKYPIYMAFRQEFDTWDLLRKPSSFQVNSGARELFEELLTNNPKINVNKHKTCVGILNDIWRECERDGGKFR